MLPAHGRAGNDGISHRLTLSGQVLQQILVEVQTIPVHNHALDQPFAGIGYLLLLLTGVRNLPVSAVKDNPGERMDALKLVELVVDALAPVLVVHVAQQKFGAHRLAQLAQGQVHGVMLGIGIEAPQHGGGRHVLLFETHDQSQQRVPLRLNQRLVNSLNWGQVLRRQVGHIYPDKGVEWVFLNK